jgi:hypothetical protein
MSWKRILTGWGLAATVMFSSAAAGPLTISYAYNVGGRLVGVDYGSNNVASYAYDMAGNLLQSSTPSPSLDAVTASASQITLIWPAFPGGFVLEKTAQLGAGAQWQAVNVTVVQVGDQSTATVPLGQTAFYRLRKP